MQVRCYEDLTGTRIVSNKPVSVVAGADWTSVAHPHMGDHLIEQMPSTASWGVEFVTVPIATRTSGDVFRVLGR